MLGLYIHIPFCNQICKFCDFYKMVASNELKQKTIDYIIKEMDYRHLSDYQFDTLYIGGGSPGSLNEELSVYFFSSLHRRVNLANLNEFSIELNPQDITDEYCKILKQFHVSRVSIGVQTFNENLAKKLGRNPFVKWNEIKQKIALLNQYGITNINLDLIYAIPGETLEDLENDLYLASQLSITHLSCYALILEEHSILGYELKKGCIQLIDEELDTKMYQFIIDYLEKNQFMHYETSNFSFKGYESQHNLIYWHYDEYIGIGPNASGHFAHQYYTNHHLSDYFISLDNCKLPIKELNEESLQDEMENYLMMGLRLTKGISKNEFTKRFKVNLETAFPKIKNLYLEGLLLEEKGKVYIPKKYFYIMNYILTKII